MRQQKDTQRSTVSIGFDGRVHKVFRGPDAETRFATEVRVLRFLEAAGCPFVPRLLDSDPESLKIITSNCGAIVETLSDSRVAALFEELEQFGVRHDDPFLRNVTYRASDGRFCVIDFEFATILTDGDVEAAPLEKAQVAGQLEVQWSCATDVGRFRKNNEDVYLALALDAEGGHHLGSEGVGTLDTVDLIFAVADGMGGARAGEFASRIAVEKITQLLPRFFRQGGGASHAEMVMTDLFRLIHMEIGVMGEAYPECEGMGTTFSLCWFSPGRLVTAHVGDSRIYRQRSNEVLEQLTADDSHVGHLLRSGQINEREARSHPRRNVLNKALGDGQQYIDPQTSVHEIAAGDRFFLCTDGMIDAMWDKHVSLALEEGTPAPELVKSAVATAGRDNASAVVVGVGAQG